MARNKGIAKTARDRRRQDALARQQDYDRLTPQEKLARLDAAGLTAAKQRAALERGIAREAVS